VPSPLPTILHVIQLFLPSVLLVKRNQRKKVCVFSGNVEEVFSSVNEGLHAEVNKPCWKKVLRLNSAASVPR
jgi:hypothetical protein